MSCPEFVEKGTQVLGISTDSSASSAAFAALLGNIPYPLLSDFEPKGRVARLYGVYNEERGTANRSVIIVDKQGIVRFKRLYAAVSEFNTDDVLAAVDKL